MRLMCIACVVVSLAGAGRAAGDLIELTLSGAINFSNMGAFPAGQGMTIAIRFESSTPLQSVQSNQAFFVDAMKKIHIVSGAWDTTDTGAFGQNVMLDGAFGVDSIAFQVAANQATYQFTSPKPQAVNLDTIVSNSVVATFVNMFVNLTSSNTSLWTGFNLPTTFNFADFDNTKNFGFEFSTGSFGGGWTSLSYAEVPEPVSGLLFAVCGLQFAVRRRRGKAKLACDVI